MMIQASRARTLETNASLIVTDLFRRTSASTRSVGIQDVINMARRSKAETVDIHCMDRFVTFGYPPPPLARNIAEERYHMALCDVWIEIGKFDKRSIEVDLPKAIDVSKLLGLVFSTLSSIDIVIMSGSRYDKKSVDRLYRLWCASTDKRLTEEQVKVLLRID
jgi:hypothetical protein